MTNSMGSQHEGEIGELWVSFDCRLTANVLLMRGFSFPFSSPYYFS